jgi:outer membrane lipoprotein-sorting protein
MKKWLVLFAVAMGLMFFTACSSAEFRGTDEEVSAFEATHRMLVELRDFRAIATVEYHSNKGTNVYETVQHGRITGEYRVEVTSPPHVAGSITVSDNAQIFQFNGRFAEQAAVLQTETPERSEIFLTSFIRNYLQSDTISVSVSTVDEGVRTILEAAVPGGHHYLHTSRLYVCNETLSPLQLVVFDADGVQRIVVTYHVFEKNIDPSDALFTM